MGVPETHEAAVELDELRESGRELVALDGVPIAVFHHEGEVRAVNNRCPHMGFPLTEGTVDEGILTCEWHHARFELSCGNTFDPWADDVETYPTLVEDGTVYVNPNPERDRSPAEHWRERLEDGLERNIRLVIAKSAVGLADAGVPVSEQLEAGVAFGTRYRQGGWSSGLTILTALSNVAADLDPQDRQRAMYQGLTEVASDCADEPPKFEEDEFDTREVPYDRLKEWFRDCVEVRDPDGAERCLRTAVACGHDDAELAEIVAAATTDHRYLSTGHAFDHFNKATEALDRVGWDEADAVLSSLVENLTSAERSEELAEWRRPDDLAGMCEDLFDRLDDLVAAGEGEEWTEPDDFTETLRGSDPEPIFDALETAIRNGATVEQLAGAVAYAAATRVARFGTSNEFVDWNTVHHTFTYANAVHRMAERVDAPELYRGVVDAAVNVYLDRFLNTPPAPYPDPAPDADPDEALADLRLCFETEGEVDAAARATARYLDGGGDPDRLKAELGNALLIEDTNFHTFQALEAAFSQYDRREDPAERRLLLVALARYMAAHYPTRREREGTFSIATRLHRGEAVHE
ncbi:Rieske (2Fe-2S) protein [Haloparvum sedimenti]|uniref:Rieske (2Fe-2S) protein n=1 Tax=Haloparvum sedimenti TaxID=1678448 RepID=UPI00071E6ACB|nr:Rieske 2Fe-2S domain-containing protein [Haloparvum sedimenti]